MDLAKVLHVAVCWDDIFELSYYKTFSSFLSSKYVLFMSKFYGSFLKFTHIVTEMPMKTSDR